MYTDSRLIAVILSISAALAGQASAQTTPRYALTILGLVQHNYITSVFAPLSINDNGVVAGYAKVKVPHNPQQSVRGVEWQGSSPHYTILGTISEYPGQDSEATWINNLGIAVGFSNEHLGSDRYSAHPVMFNANGIVNLGVKNAKEGFATGINNASQVVGYLDFDTPVPASEAFLYQNGVMTMLGYPVPTIGYSLANAINSNGLIVGSAKFSTAAKPHAASYANGVWTDLGTPGSGTNCGSSASSVNDSGAIVGLWSDSVEIYPSVFLYQNGQITDLGALAGSATPPVINNSGQIVSGWFLYDNGTWWDLHNVIIPNGHWQIKAATAINNEGVIACTIFNNLSEDRAGLLTPVNSN